MGRHQPAVTQLHVTESGGASKKIDEGFHLPLWALTTVRRFWGVVFLFTLHWRDWGRCYALWMLLRCHTYIEARPRGVGTSHQKKSMS